MTETATLVVTATPDPDGMASVQAYLQGVMPLFQAAGGRLVKRLKATQALHGTPGGMVLVMDFDSAGSIAELFASSAYAELIPLRDKGFARMDIAIAETL